LRPVAAKLIEARRLRQAVNQCREVRQPSFASEQKFRLARSTEAWAYSGQASRGKEAEKGATLDHGLSSLDIRRAAAGQHEMAVAEIGEGTIAFSCAAVAELPPPNW
jgi:hypothetical protein